MKKKVMIFMLGLLFVGVNAMAADGDLQVDGILSLGGAPSSTSYQMQVFTNYGGLYFESGNSSMGLFSRFESPGPNIFQQRSFTNNNNHYPTFQGVRGRGSLASKQSPLSGDILYGVDARGYSGGEGHLAAQILFKATEDFNNDYYGSSISFYTTPNGNPNGTATNDITERLKIDHNGNVGIGTTTPKSTLQVNGYVQLALTPDAPPTTDCDAVSELGRMIVDNVNGFLYICVDSGWVQK